MRTLSLSEETPAASPSAAPIPPAQSAPGSPEALKNVVSEADAIGASAHTKISTIMGITGGPAGSQPTGSSVPLGGLVDAKLAINLVDAVLPSALVLVLYKVGVKLRKADLQLTEKEKDTLAPILNKCLDSLMINFNNPWNALGISLLTIYGAKIMEKGGVAWFDAKKEKEEGKVVPMKKNNATPETASKTPGVELSINDMWEPPEDMVEAKAKKDKSSREKAIKALKTLHSRGKKLV